MKKIKNCIAAPVVLALFLLLAGPRAQALAPGDPVVPGGQVVGIRLEADGVIVSGVSAVETSEGDASPAERAGILPGDRIVGLNGSPVTDAESFRAAAETLDGSAATVELIRDGHRLSLSVTPAKSTKGLWQLGLWLRDEVTGIGTVTFWDPADGRYGALGHGVCLPETGVPMVIRGGTVTRASVAQVVPGERGVPGELCGMPSGPAVGTVAGNTPFGIFGTAGEALSQEPAVTVGSCSEVSLGPAEILSTVGPGGPGRYDIEITRITRVGDGTRQLSIAVTDPELLAVTGGIVQGMSGSPILQNGKLVGAVTHVLVNDPTRGYGIFIETMLDAAG